MDVRKRAGENVWMTGVGGVQVGGRSIGVVKGIYYLTGFSWVKSVCMLGRGGLHRQKINGYFRYKNSIFT